VLLEGGATVELQDALGRFALMFAAGHSCCVHLKCDRMLSHSLPLLSCLLQVLLEGGATVELQDALGRSALMFAAGSDATAACNVLLDAHASLSVRDRRGRAALDYAPTGRASYCSSLLDFALVLFTCSVCVALPCLGWVGLGLRASGGL
jgi:hypothetical protein